MKFISKDFKAKFFKYTINLLSNTGRIDMIHLIGIVFQNGTGISLHRDDNFEEDSQLILIWGLVNAIVTFAHINLRSVGRFELISGKYRMFFYNPFLGLQNLADHTYTLVAIQDVYNDVENCLIRLKSIHDLLWELGITDPLASLDFENRLTAEIVERIHNVIIVENNLSENIKDTINHVFTKFIENRSTDIIPLAVILSSKDGQYSIKKFAKDFYEDPELTEQLLQNIIAENRVGANTIWMERPASRTIVFSLEGKTHTSLEEVFCMLKIGQQASNYCLLARILYDHTKRDECHNILENLSNQLANLLRMNNASPHPLTQVTLDDDIEKFIDEKLGEA